jgi:hypothetical protein
MPSMIVDRIHRKSQISQRNFAIDETLLGSSRTDSPPAENGFVPAQWVSAENGFVPARWSSPRMGSFRHGGRRQEWVRSGMVKTGQEMGSFGHRELRPRMGSFRHPGMGPFEPMPSARWFAWAWTASIGGLDIGCGFQGVVGSGLPLLHSSVMRTRNHTFSETEGALDPGRDPDVRGRFASHRRVTRR